METDKFKILNNFLDDASELLNSEYSADFAPLRNAYKEELAHRKLHLVGIPSRVFLHHPTKYAEKRVHYLPWFCSTQEFQSQQHKDCLHHLLAGSLGRLVI